MENIEIEVIRKNIKHLYLRVYSEKGVKISAPYRVSDEKIHQFAVSKLAWIKKQQHKSINRKKVTSRKYQSGEKHLLQGKNFILKVFEINKRPRVFLKDIYIYLCIRPRTPVKKRQEIITEWYRNQLRKQVPPVLEKWENILDLKVKEWRIKKMKQTWGSCNIKAKRIWLNLELVKKPERCLEYIIVHELLHLKERGHNKRFYGMLDTYLPGWKKLKSELNNS